MSIFSNIGKGIRNVLGSQIGKTVTSLGTNLIHDTNIGRKLAAPALGTAGFMLGGPVGAAAGAALGSRLSGQKDIGHILGTGLKGFGLASGLGSLAGAAGMSGLGSSFMPGGLGIGDMTANQLTPLSSMLGKIPGVGGILGGATGNLASLAGGQGLLGGSMGMMGLGSLFGGGGVPGSNLGGAGGGMSGGGGINPLALLGGYLGYAGSRDATNQASDLANKQQGYLDTAGQFAAIDPKALEAQKARARDTLRGAQADRGIYNSGVAARQEAEVMPMVDANLQQLAFQNAMQMGGAYNPMISAYMGNAGQFSNPFQYA